jgi:hypothetical protein
MFNFHNFSIKGLGENGQELPRCAPTIYAKCLTSDER